MWLWFNGEMHGFLNQTNHLTSVLNRYTSSLSSQFLTFMSFFFFFNKITCRKRCLLETIKTGCIYFVTLLCLCFVLIFLFLQLNKIVQLVPVIFLLFFFRLIFPLFPIFHRYFLFLYISIYTLSILNIFYSLTRFLFAFQKFLLPLTQMQVFFCNLLPLSLQFACPNVSFSSN